MAGFSPIVSQFINRASLEMRNTRYYGGCEFEVSSSYKSNGFSVIGTEIKSIKITKYGDEVDRFDFYPDERGLIDTICIYGKNRWELADSVGRRGSLWGLEITNISREPDFYELSVNATISDYLYLLS